MAFSFGFSGDDIDIDDSEINNDFSDVPSQQVVGNSLPELVKAVKHDMNEWVSDQARYFIFNYAYYAIAFIINVLSWQVYFKSQFGHMRYCPLSTKAWKHEFITLECMILVQESLKLTNMTALNSSLSNLLQ